jgi:hypothetical protein
VAPAKLVEAVLQNVSTKIAANAKDALLIVEVAEGIALLQEPEH